MMSRVSEHQTQTTTLLTCKPHPGSMWIVLLLPTRWNRREVAKMTLEVLISRNTWWN